MGCVCVAILFKLGLKQCGDGLKQKVCVCDLISPLVCVWCFTLQLQSVL